MSRREKQIVANILGPKMTAVQIKRHPAYALGQAAFVRGAKMNPMADSAFVAVAFGGKMGDSLPYFEAWNAGFTQANLAAPVEGWTAEQNEALRANRANG